VLELIKMSNILSAQDEEDRKNISLWGTKEKQRNSSQDYKRSIDHIRKSNTTEKFKLANIQNESGRYNVVTLDKDCHSCTNSNPIVLSAFKMACLSYYPSSINFEGCAVPRAWLHSKVSKIVQEVYKDYQYLHPWKSGKCDFEKYLNVTVSDVPLNNTKYTVRNSLTPNQTHMRTHTRGSFINTDKLLSPFRKRSIEASSRFIDNRGFGKSKLNQTISIQTSAYRNENLEEGPIGTDVDLDSNSQIQNASDSVSNFELLGKKMFR